MNWFDWHDEYFLQLLLGGLYRHAVWGSIVLVAVFLLLPVHRRFVQALQGVILFASLILLTFYGALSEAPLLGWVMLGCTLLSLLRASLWTAQCFNRSGAAQAQSGFRLLLHARLGRWLIRDYFRADPRSAYWLDWTRTRYRLAVKRTAEDRRGLLAEAFERPIMGTWFWHGVVFPGLEVLMSLYRFLPYYWKREIAGTAFPDPYALSLLQAEIEATEQAMYEAFAGDSFITYLERAVDPEVLAAYQLQAGYYGRKRCRLSEAKIEADLFNEHFEAQDKRLEAGAIAYFELWRFRRTYSSLWRDLLREQSDATSRSESEKNKKDSTPGDDNWSSGQSLLLEGLESLEDEDITDPHSGSTGDPQPSSHSHNLSEQDDADDVLSGFEDDDASAAAVATETDSSDGQFAPLDDGPADRQSTAKPAKNSNGRTAESHHTADTMPGGGLAVAQAESDSLATHKLDQTDESELAPSEELPADLSREESMRETDLDDSELFTEFDRAPDQPDLALQDAQNHDLKLASELLETYLGLDPADDFADAVRRTERLLDKPRLLPAAVRLLAIYCLRNDFDGPRIQAMRIEVLARLRHRFRGIPANDPNLTRTRALFYDMYFDILSEWGAYGTLRELFDNRNPQTPHQWQLLGDALAHTALQIRESSSLRNDRLREAASAYFRARTRSFWTQRYAGLLLETESALETMKLFTNYPVETQPISQNSSEGDQRVARVAAAASPTATGKSTSKTPSKQPVASAPGVPQAEASVPPKTRKLKTWKLHLLEPVEKSRDYTLQEFNGIPGLPLQLDERNGALVLKLTGDVRKVKVNNAALAVNSKRLSIGDRITIQKYLFEVRR